MATDDGSGDLQVAESASDRGGTGVSGTGVPPVIRRLTDMDAELQEPVKAPEEPTVIFDPAKLAAQLSELLELYLARAKEALLEEQMSSKEAVACAKQVSSMLEDTQSGKLQQVDTSTHWPRLEFARIGGAGIGGTGVGGTGVSPVIRHLSEPIHHPRTRGLSPASSSVEQPTTDNQQPLRSLADAVKAVCQYDPETAILEPWALLLTRINKLTQRLSADIEAWKSSCEQQEDRSRELQFAAPSKPRDLEVASPAKEGGTGVSGTGACPPQSLNEGCRRDPPVIPPKPAPSRATGSTSPPAGDWKLEAGSGFT
jgi:hypothetical protein